MECLQTSRIWKKVKVKAMKVKDDACKEFKVAKANAEKDGMKLC